MIRSCLLAVLLLAPGIVASQPTETRADFRERVEKSLREVSRLWQTREIERAVAILEELASHDELEEMPWARRGTLYNLACGYALLGRKEEALSHLRAAARAGFSDIDHIERDPDLDGIRDLPGFRKIIRELEAFAHLWESPVLNTPYSEDLPSDVKVAGLSKLWSEVKYNFVFFDRVPGLSWDSLYVEFLPQVRKTTSTLEYYRTLKAMTARLQDGHTGVNFPPELYDATSYRPPVRTRLVEDTVVIVEVGDEAATSTNPPLRPGLEIVRVEGIPVKDYARERTLPYVRASTHQGRNVWVYDYGLLLGRKDETCRLDLRDPRGNMRKVSLTRSVPVMVRPDAEPHLQILHDGIAHLTIGSFADNSVVSGFDSLFTSLEASEALVIDLRDNGGGNSSVGYALLGHLSDRPIAIVRCSTRDYRPTRRAQGFKVTWHEEPPEQWAPGSSTAYEKPVAVLISPRTGSAAEDFCAVFRHMGRGKLVGEPTAGSTGQPLVFGLPGGGNAMVCTASCAGPGGEEFVGVGIQPDIEVRPTVEDVGTGRDPVLDAAVQVLRSPDRGPEDHMD